MRIVCPVLSIGFVVLAAAAPAPVGAGESSPVTEAKRHFDIGAKLVAAEDFMGAALEFEASVSAYPTKSGYFNLAGTYKALHRYADALEALAQLETQFSGDMDDVMRRKANELKALILKLVGDITVLPEPKQAEITIDGAPVPREKLGKPLVLGPGIYKIEATLDGYTPAVQSVTLRSGQKLEVRIRLVPQMGRLKIRANMPNATVSVDNETIGRTPIDRPLELKPGRHDVRIVLSGYLPIERTVNLEADSTVALDVQLAPVPAAVTQPSGPDVGQPDPAPVAESPTKASELSGTPTASPFHQLKIASIVGAVVAGAATGVFYGMAAKYAADFNEYNDAYATTPSEVSAETYDSKRRDADEKNGTFANLGLAFGITTGILVASSVVFGVFSKRKGKSESGAALRVLPGAVQVSF